MPQDPYHRAILTLSLLHTNFFSLFQAQESTPDSHNGLSQQGKGQRVLKEWVYCQKRWHVSGDLPAWGAKPWAYSESGTSGRENLSTKALKWKRIYRVEDKARRLIALRLNSTAELLRSLKRCHFYSVVLAFFNIKKIYFEKEISHWKGSNTVQKFISLWNIWE